MLQLENVKLYLRIDDDVEDDLIGQMITIADNFVSSGITDYDLKITDEKFQTKADFCKLAVVSEMYENRNLLSTKQQDFSYMIKSMMAQLEYEEVETAETEVEE